MTESDRELVGRSSIAALDAIAAGIDASLGGAPLATGAWGLMKAWNGNTLALRQKKAIEWLEMIRDDPKIFTRAVLEDENFQDAWVLCFESYLKERDVAKRLLLRNIFKDYTSLGATNEYPLERYYDLARQITLHEAKLLSKLISRKTDDGKSIPVEREDIEACFRLMSLGLLIQDVTPTFVSDEPGPRAPSVFVSVLGMKFSQFIVNPDLD